MKCGLQPQEKLEKMLIVLIGGFLICILKHECHMDDGTVKAIIEFYACLRSSDIWRKKVEVRDKNRI